MNALKGFSKFKREEREDLKNFDIRGDPSQTFRMDTRELSNEPE